MAASTLLDSPAFASMPAMSAMPSLPAISTGLSMGTIPSMTGGAGGAASSGQTSSNGFNDSGWSVNIGSGSASGAPAMSPYMIAGLAVAGFLLWKMSKK